VKDNNLVSYHIGAFDITLLQRRLDTTHNRKIGLADIVYGSLGLHYRSLLIDAAKNAVKNNKECIQPEYDKIPKSSNI
jgi:hypothetical protein